MCSLILLIAVVYFAMTTTSLMPEGQHRDSARDVAEVRSPPGGCPKLICCLASFTSLVQWWREDLPTPRLMGRYEERAQHAWHAGICNWRKI